LVSRRKQKTTEKDKVKKKEIEKDGNANLLPPERLPFLNNSRGTLKLGKVIIATPS
jgi:hypothetical protein